MNIHLLAPASRKIYLPPPSSVLLSLGLVKLTFTWSPPSHPLQIIQRPPPAPYLNTHGKSGREDDIHVRHQVVFGLNCLDNDGSATSNARCQRCALLTDNHSLSQSGLQ